MPTFYKITGPTGESLHGGSGNWHLPKGKRPGKWMPIVNQVKACRAGYHLIPARAITEWLPPAGKTGRLWEAEGRGAQDKDGDKIVFAEARLIRCVGVLDEVSMRLAAADMAERVLAARAAAWNAAGFAGDAAWDAAWNAAMDAAWNASGRAIIAQAAARMEAINAVAQ